MNTTNKKKALIAVYITGMIFIQITCKYLIVNEKVLQANLTNKVCNCLESWQDRNNINDDMNNINHDSNNKERNNSYVPSENYNGDKTSNAAKYHMDQTTKYIFEGMTR